MGTYETSDPEKVMTFAKQAIDNDHIVMTTFAFGRLLYIQPGWLTKLEDGYLARYSWHGWAQAMDGTLPEGQEFTINTSPEPAG
jgi:hypothetical protein